jgi:predicted CXXCH cytochrome family protein
MASWPWIVCASVAWLMLLGACAPATRMRVLTFFFDGVPGAEPDAGPKHRQKRSAFMQEALPLALGKPRPAIKVPAALPIVSRHQPVEKKQCQECHDVGASFAPLGRDAALCDRCHQPQRLREGWSHGPINLGQCIPCHRAHESPYEHLLSKPVPELCMDCHQDEMDRKRVYHDIADLNRCVACHDPHRMY